jgi:hypothetical protein
MILAAEEWDVTKISQKRQWKLLYLFTICTLRENIDFKATLNSKLEIDL